MPHEHVAQAAATPKVGDLHKFVCVLRGIDLIVPPGSVTVLIGPSGSENPPCAGINRLESIDAGRIKRRPHQDA